MSVAKQLGHSSAAASPAGALRGPHLPRRAAGTTAVGVHPRAFRPERIDALAAIDLFSDGRSGGADARSPVCHVSSGSTPVGWAETAWTAERVLTEIRAMTKVFESPQAPQQNRVRQVGPGSPYYFRLASKFERQGLKPHQVQGLFHEPHVLPKRDRLQSQ